MYVTKPCKLKNGKWGVSCDDVISIGDTVRIRARNAEWTDKVTATGIPAKGTVGRVYETASTNMSFSSEGRARLQKAVRADSRWSEYRSEHDLDSARMPIAQWVSIAREFGIDPTSFTCGESDDLDDLPEPKRTEAAPVETNDSVQAAINQLTAALSNSGMSQMDEGRVIELIKTHSRAPLSIEIPQEYDEPKRIDGVHHMYPKVYAAVSTGQPVLLVGEAGSGKTTLARQVCEALGYNFAFCGSLQDEYALFGFIDANGKPVHTQFRQAMESGDTGWLFDEIDGSMPNAMVAVNAFTANRLCVFPDKKLEVSADVPIMAAANTYGHGADRQYIGRYQQDAASLDRWTVLTIDIDEKLEASMTDNQEWVTRVQKYRKAKNEQKIRHVISPRATIAGARLLATGQFTLDEAEDATIWKGLDAAQIKKIKAAA